MTEQLAVLAHERHGHLALREENDFGFARQSNFVPVWSGELYDVARAFPIAFCKEAAGWTAVAVMGLLYRENVWVRRDGTWGAQYCPAALRAYPFMPVECMEEDGEKSYVGVVENASQLVDASELAESRHLFDARGEASPLTEERRRLVAGMARARAMTRQHLAMLDAAGLLVPWGITRLDESGQPSAPFDGLFQVDDNALTGLAGELVAMLHREGALEVAYAHRVSRGAVRVLAAVVAAAAREESAKPPQPAAGRAGNASESLFQFY